VYIYIYICICICNEGFLYLPMSLLRSTRNSPSSSPPSLRSLPGSPSLRFIIFDHAHAHPFELSVRCRPRRRATTTSDFFTGRRTTRARAVPRPARAFRTGYKARTRLARRDEPRLARRGEPRLARRGRLPAGSSMAHWMFRARARISCFT